MSLFLFFIRARLISLPALTLPAALWNLQILVLLSLGGSRENRGRLTETDLLF